MEEKAVKTEKPKATTRQQLAALYGIKAETLNKWIQRAGIKVPPRVSLTPKQLNQLFEALGEP